MARTPIYHEEKKAQIVQAALTTFAKYGYEGTTNKLIAQEAGKLIGPDGKPISPALIYHYFPEGKPQLFTACLQQFPSLQKFRQIIIDNSQQPPEVFLRVVANTYNNLLGTEGVLPIIRIVIGEGPRQPDLLNSLMSILAPEMIGPLLDYFQKQIQHGQTWKLKPDQLAMMLMAPLFMRRTMLSTFPAAAMLFIQSSDEEFIETLVQTILRGSFHE